VIQEAGGSPDSMMQVLIWNVPMLGTVEKSPSRIFPYEMVSVVIFMALAL
jgi:hypothetical protein